MSGSPKSPKRPKRVHIFLKKFVALSLDKRSRQLKHGKKSWCLISLWYGINLQNWLHPLGLHITHQLIKDLENQHPFYSMNNCILGDIIFKSYFTCMWKTWGSLTWCWPLSPPSMQSYSPLCSQSKNQDDIGQKKANSHSLAITGEYTARVRPSSAIFEYLRHGKNLSSASGQSELIAPHFVTEHRLAVFIQRTVRVYHPHTEGLAHAPRYSNVLFTCYRWNSQLVSPPDL
jgi:hypothetical protein